MKKRISANGKPYWGGTPANVHVCATSAEKNWLKAHGGDSKGFHAGLTLAMADEVQQTGLSPEDVQGLKAVRAMRALLTKMAPYRVTTTEAEA